jgi:hypothetical protein
MSADKHYVCYEDFGAVGDGVADDFTAIRLAHDFANANGLQVVSDPRKIYYIGNDPATALIMTDTNWSTTRFIIDDTRVAIEDREHEVFKVCSAQAAVELEASSLKKEQARLFCPLDQLHGNAFVVAVNEAQRQFMRVGPNVSVNGSAQTDCFILDQSGAVLTPIIWDFEALTRLSAYPMDERTLNIKGGVFTTIANQAESKYTYYRRGVSVTRSNVEVDGLVHNITGELDHGAPYHGFVRVEDCAYVTFRNCHFSPHKIYSTIGAANVPVMMGSYDISLYRSIGVSFINCKQDNITDMTRWGIWGSNYCKDLLVDGCTFSRTDAHMDATNFTIRNSTIGWMGIKAIGHSRLVIENVTIFSDEVVQLRPDYGSSWDGELIMRNVTWYPINRPEHKRPLAVITGDNPGGHDFGYPCSQPRRVEIENLRVMDNGMFDTFVSVFGLGPAANENVKSFDEPEEGDHPYIFTSQLTLKGLSTQSGQGYSIWMKYPQRGYCEKKHRVKDGTIVPNFRAEVDGIDGLTIAAGGGHASDYGENHRLVPRITVKNCDRLEVARGEYPLELNVIE